MTNEKLAELIQEGDNDELLPLLWDKTRLLIYQKCGRLWQFYSEKLERFGYSFDDLQQVGYNALIFAVKGYKSEKGYKFATYLTCALKRVIRDLLSGSSDVLNLAGTQSLEQPLGENSEGDTESARNAPNSHFVILVVTFPMQNQNRRSCAILEAVCVIHRLSRSKIWRAACVIRKSG